MNNTYLNGLDFNVGIYIRLSQEDKDKKYESDSESVIWLRSMWMMVFLVLILKDLDFKKC